VEVHGGLGEDIKATPLGCRRKVVKVLPDFRDVLVAEGAAVDLSKGVEITPHVGKQEEETHSLLVVPLEFGEIGLQVPQELLYSLSARYIGGENTLTPSKT
jgi:hypothetical protein